MDWGARDSTWTAALRAWKATASDAPPRIVVFGPHADLEAHAAARSAGFGPMKARSALFAALPELLDA